MSTDQEPRAVAIIAAINAELPAGVLAYEVDKVPGTTGGPSGTTPVRYVTVELSRRWHPERRGDADMIPGFSLVTHYRAPGINGVGGARDLRDAVTAALENRAYPLPDGDTVGPFSFEFDGGLNYVASGWSGFDSWRF